VIEFALLLVLLCWHALYYRAHSRQLMTDQLHNVLGVEDLQD
jgi:hypothetical protein